MFYPPISKSLLLFATLHFILCLLLFATLHFILFSQKLCILRWNDPFRKSRPPLDPCQWRIRYPHDIEQRPDMTPTLLPNGGLRQLILAEIFQEWLRLHRCNVREPRGQANGQIWFIMIASLLAAQRPELSFPIYFASIFNWSQTNWVITSQVMSIWIYYENANL